MDGAVGVGIAMLAAAYLWSQAAHRQSTDVARAALMLFWFLTGITIARILGFME